MLPKAHLTLHSRMPGSRWVITPSWLSGSWRSFLYRSFVYSWHLLLISSISVRSLQFLSFIALIFAWNFPLVSQIFLKRSLVFPNLLFFSISLNWPLMKSFLSMANRWGNSERLYLGGGSKITADDDCSLEIKRPLLLGRKVMTNLDSILKNTDITLPTKVHLITAMVFPVAMYECESWTIKKAERKELMLLNCNVGEDSWESLGL